ncbi:similar to Saccharomyces cerevisiae YER157W COG3 Essential component of the conserved oligomeric Golgi complex (Cog1p through Cog8p) [Maudiozyma saulgeensis]|uniref:Conserved oligomeric Golgi complex subunit 3 n=1 Tax=Maudiozyma saulgeensis TaxID=1789683 RepID=A0A1X7R7N5_9SACH|nr:similar to Saccharomyces cerevisiae YER157W COG3 Essential component of the conserved oligomeric Golgi complex (Cog1p through Cog8p) [Kazachstania saulgeensis]
MVRSRRNSLVQTIAVQPTLLEPQENSLLDDSYLLENLQKLATVINGTTDKEILSLNSIVKSSVESLDSVTTPDKYSQYTDYLTQLDENIKDYDNILKQTHRISNQLEDSLSQFNTISDQSSGFIKDTHTLYDSRKEFVKLSQALPQYLTYFDNLAPIIRRLNHASSPNIVRKESFKTMLSNIDKSLFFLEENPDILESEAYRIKYKQCLIRACDLISKYSINNLKQIQSEITQKDIMANKNTRDALIYNKFSSISDDFKQNISALIDRATDEKYKRYNSELTSILNDTFEQYFQIRYKFLNQIIWLQVDDTIIRDKKFSMIQFIQDNKTYFQQLCNKEYKLFMEFFPEDSICKDRINHWFIKLCDPFYVTIGVKCGRESDIDILCDSLILFEPFYQFEEDSEEYAKQFNEVQFDKIFSPVLTRIQNRLIQTVKNYIHRTIVSYKPSAEDFMISNKKLKLQDDEGFVKTYVSNFRNDNTVTATTTSSSDKTENNNAIIISSYYIPLIKGLALLFKIFEMVNPLIFDQLAHHTVHSCISSLKNAYTIITRNESPDTSLAHDLDIKLFYLRNLLLLRDEIQEFNIKYTLNTKSLDFSGVESFFKNYKAGEMSLFSLAKDFVPKVVDNMLDARTELVQELRICIKDFTDVASTDIIGDYLMVTTPEKLTTVNTNLTSCIENRIPRIYEQICHSIEDKEIAQHLIEAIEQYCNDQYSEFHDKVVTLGEQSKLSSDDVLQLVPPEVFNQAFKTLVNQTLKK